MVRMLSIIVEHKLLYALMENLVVSKFQSD